MKNNSALHKGLAALTLTAVLAGARLNAAVLNFQFRGTIYDVQTSDPLLDGSLQPGAPFEGFFIFDPATPDDNPVATLGEYSMAAPTNLLVVKIGNCVFRSHPQQGQMLFEVCRYDSNVYNFMVISYVSVCSQPLAIDQFSLSFADATTLRDDDTLPVAPPVLLAQHDPSTGLLLGGGRGDEVFLIQGEVEVLTNNPAVIETRPATQLTEALEIRWPSTLGCYYRVNYTPEADHFDFTDFQGDGLPLAHFLPKGAEARFGLETFQGPPDEATDEAERVTVRFSGRITRVDDPGYLLNEMVAVDTPFEGLVVAETGGNDWDDSPDTGLYYLETMNCKLMVKVGDFLFTSDPAEGFWISTGPASYEDTNTLDWVTWSDYILCREGLPVRYIFIWLTAERLLNISGGRGMTDLNIEGCIEQAQGVPPILATNPPVTLRPAVQLSWPSALGYFYTLQTSTNMAEWENVGQPVLGDGATLTRHLPKMADTNVFYRVEILNHPKSAPGPPQP